MGLSRILLATDFDSVASAALETTARLAVTLEARVHVLYVLEALMYAIPDMANMADRDPRTHPEATRKVTAAVDQLKARGVRDVDGATEYGIARDVIIGHAKASEFDLLVIGSHRRGTTVGEIVQRSAIPVMAVPSVASGAVDGAHAFKHILVPTDFQDSAEQALDLATTLAMSFSAKLTLVHAERPPTDKTGSRQTSPEFEQNAWMALDAAVTRAKARYPNVEGVLTIGSRWERILEVAHQRGADLIVMGTHGRAALSRVLLGSVAERVVNMSSVPVLTTSASA